MGAEVDSKREPQQVSVGLPRERPCEHQDTQGGDHAVPKNNQPGVEQPQGRVMERSDCEVGLMKKIEPTKKEFVVTITITEPDFGLGQAFVVKTAHLEQLTKAFSMMAEILLTKLAKLEQEKQ
jgi:hypothetical protein